MFKDNLRHKRLQFSELYSLVLEFLSTVLQPHVFHRSHHTNLERKCYLRGSTFMQFSTTKPAGVENNWIILCSKQIKENVDIYLLTEDKDDEDPGEGDVKHGDSYVLVRGERWDPSACLSCSASDTLLYSSLSHSQEQQTHRQKYLFGLFLNSK